MSLKDKSAEIQRLIDLFETEAGKFHDIEFYTYHIMQNGGPILSKKFKQPNHAIMLWQYYGKIASEGGIERVMGNLERSNLQWGLRGAELTFMGVIEGSGTPLFVRMAARAGSLFTDDESRDIKSRIVSEIQEQEKATEPSGIPTAVVNGNPLSIWLNFLLYHLSKSNPGRDRAHKIEPDPFSLSLLALERLAVEKAVVKTDRSTAVLKNLRFKVAVSFPGELRRYVSQVVDSLRAPLGKDSVFYDFDYQAQLARPNLDTLLQRIYRKQSDLIVVFLCGAYARKEWCGLEWRAVRDIIKAKEDERVMFVRLDDMPVDGLLSIDGYIDGTKNTPQQIASFILTRVAELEDGS
ncbi:MAG TPA: disease resistance protein [Deltaproteobacteria bacterium]|nr:disease resistance protein [Deltaproteobacteria bacterium]